MTKVSQETKSASPRAAESGTQPRLLLPGPIFAAAQTLPGHHMASPPLHLHPGNSIIHKSSSHNVVFAPQLAHTWEKQSANTEFPTPPALLVL